MHRGLYRKSVFVRLSVRLSITFVYYVEMSKHILELFSSSSPSFYDQFFHTKSYGNIQTGAR